MFSASDDCDFLRWSVVMGSYTDFLASSREVPFGEFSVFLRKLVSEVYAPVLTFLARSLMARCDGTHP